MGISVLPGVAALVQVWENKATTMPGNAIASIGGVGGQCSRAAEPSVGGEGNKH